MTEILWKVGDRSRAVIVIPCLEVVIDPPLTFTFDGVTEKVGLTAADCQIKQPDLTANISATLFLLRLRGGGGQMY